MKKFHPHPARTAVRQYHSRYRWALLLLASTGAVNVAGCHTRTTATQHAGVAPTSNSAESVPSAVNPDIKAKVDSAKRAGEAMGRAEADFHRSHPVASAAPR